MNEWLVTDHEGAFAMGTPAGFRSRKYHGFYLGIAGRSETAFLVDFEIECGGQRLWPHSFAGPDGPVLAPDPTLLATALGCTYQLAADGPSWGWKLPDGDLGFQVRPGLKGGMQLLFSWLPRDASSSVPLKIRPFFAMRDLHGNGGSPWTWSAESPGHAVVKTQSGHAVQCVIEGELEWVDTETWYRQFHYSEEAARGYVPDEDLYSAGELRATLIEKSAFRLTLAESRADLHAPAPSRKSGAATLASLPAERALDFVLQNPPGVVAGYPWFGEWGRDTFISLPGIACAWLEAGGSEAEVWKWTRTLLADWGKWISTVGMLPNLNEKEGSHQWESADATLWWTHALAGLWSLSLAGFKKFKAVEEFAVELDSAIGAIENGRHMFLRQCPDGRTLEVTEPHTSWMDARLEGAAVTPRIGKLPEINALWFQARCLQILWGRTGSADELIQLANAALGCREPGRPNEVFMYSLPLAPRFVLDVLLRKEPLSPHSPLNLSSGFEALQEITDRLWTPVGLRTLDPARPGYRGRCVGTQEERDRAYHQGTVWAWLGGHYEMARSRFPAATRAESMFSPEVLAGMPIDGHIPEIFDAEEPHAPRGAPAQAWSLACLREARTRARLELDAKFEKILFQRLKSATTPKKESSTYDQRTTA